MLLIRCIGGVLGKTFLQTHRTCFRSLIKRNTFSTKMGSNIFEGKIDRFNGVTVHSEIEQCELSELNNKLEESIKTWIDLKRRGIWFRVHLQQADWVPVLAKKGFRYHHAKEEYVMMVRWLPLEEQDNIPKYAHTLIGVGAVVVNDKNEILVVSEKYMQRPHWKLPGGYVEPEENLIDAAQREVFEETGIETDSSSGSIIGLRHAHHAMFECGDIYIVVSLRPLSNVINKCEQELKAAEWMNIPEYLEHPHIHALNKQLLRDYIDQKERGLSMKCEHGIHAILKKPYTFYNISWTGKDCK